MIEISSIGVDVKKLLINRLVIADFQNSNILIRRVYIYHEAEAIPIVNLYQSNDVSIDKGFGDNYSGYKVVIEAELDGVVFTKEATVNVEFE